jgi:hypothetical protein
MNRTIPQVSLRFNVPLWTATRCKRRYANPFLASLPQFRQVPGTQHCVIDRQEIQPAMREIQRVIGNV